MRPTLHSLFSASVVARALAPLIPKPQLSGSSETIFMLRGIVTEGSNVITCVMVGNCITSLLKVIVVFGFVAFFIVTCTPLSRVKPTPDEPILDGFLCSCILNIHEMFAGAHAVTCDIFLEVNGSFLCLMEMYFL